MTTMTKTATFTVTREWWWSCRSPCLPKQLPGSPPTGTVEGTTLVPHCGTALGTAAPDEARLVEGGDECKTPNKVLARRRRQRNQRQRRQALRAGIDAGGGLESVLGPGSPPFEGDAGMPSNCDDAVYPDEELALGGRDEALPDEDLVSRGNDAALPDGELVSNGDDAALADEELAMGGRDEALPVEELVARGDEAACPDQDMLPRGEETAWPDQETSSSGDHVVQPDEETGSGDEEMAGGEDDQEAEALQLAALGLPVSFGRTQVWW